MPQIDYYKAEINFLTTGVCMLHYTTAKLENSKGWLEYKVAHL